jgi:hypothetical protein
MRWATEHCEKFPEGPDPCIVRLAAEEEIMEELVKKPVARLLFVNHAFLILDLEQVV